MRPFKIVNDRGFQSLIKTGCSEHYIPSLSIVSYDVKKILIKCQERIACLLQICHCHEIDETIQLNHTYQNYGGKLNFMMDAWTSPNHKAYVTVSVHFKVDRKMVTMLLDLVEVAQSHRGLNLTIAFAKILDDFEISDKVSCCTHDEGEYY